MLNHPWQGKEQIQEIIPENNIIYVCTVNQGKGIHICKQNMRDLLYDFLLNKKKSTFKKKYFSL